jgi:cell division protein FtsA
VWYQIPSEYSDKLLGGIILTGGGANMKNIETAFINHTHIEKIRIAKSPTQTILSNHEDIKSRNGMMNTVLGLLIKGDINCAGEAIDPNGNLFEQNRRTEAPTMEQRARQAGEVPTGTVRTEIEKQKAEEIARQKREEEERAAREKAEAEAEEAARLKRENSKWNKFKTGALKFVKGMVEEEE